jgi:hypothetical protein
VKRNEDQAVKHDGEFFPQPETWTEALSGADPVKVTGTLSVVAAGERLPVVVKPNDRMATGQVPVPATTTTSTPTTQVLPPHPQRSRALLTNTGTETAYIGLQGVTVNSGYPLAANATMELRNRSGVYAACATGVAVVAYLAEYLDGE